MPANAAHELQPQLRAFWQRFSYLSPPSPSSSSFPDDLVMMWCSPGSGSENWKLIFSRSTSLDCITQEVSGHYWPTHKQWLWAKQLGAGHSCVAQQCIVTRGPGSRSTDMLNLTPADPHRAVTVTYTTFFRDTNSHSRFVYWHSLLALIASELVCEHGHFYSTPIMQNMGAWGQIERGSWLDHVLIIAFQNFCTKQTLPASQQNSKTISYHFPHSTSC